MKKIHTPSRLVVALLVGLAAVGGALAQSTMPLAIPSATGSYLAGREALQDMNTQEAASYYLDAARSDWENLDIVTSAFEALLADGQVPRAVDVASHVLELDPTNGLAHIFLGTVALKERRYTSALNDFNAVQSNSFLGITAGILKGWAQVGKGDLGQAQKSLDAISRNGIEDFLRFHRALMADVAGKPKEALGLMRQAYENQPNDIRLVEAYTRMLMAAGDFKGATKVLDDFAAVGWSAPFTEPLRADIAAGRGAAKLIPNPQAGAAEMYYGIGRALTQDGSHDLAAEFYNLGLYLHPAADNISVALASIFENAKQYERANALYRALPESSPYKPSASVRIAENIQALGDRPEAIRRLHNIVVTQPDNFDAIIALADQLRFAERYKEATTYYSRALEIAGGSSKKTNWSIYYARGIAYERSGQWDKAELDFKAALKLSPNQPQVLNYLGYTWVDRGENLDEALKMIQKAIDWDPTDGYVVDSLGWAYYRLGRLDQAVKTLEQAVELRPSDPEINDHLGDAYWRVGRKLEAGFQWNIAADLDTTGNVKARVAKKLESGLPETDVSPTPREGAAGGASGGTSGGAGN